MTQSPVVLPSLERQPAMPLHRLLQLIQRAWHWLEQKRMQQTSSRRLRVTETVSLGEKRFVSIIKVDGEEMLIGVSGASVSLLTVLKTKSTHAGQQLPGAEENS